MGDSTEKQKKPGFFAGVKAEFKKITWPDRRTTVKQSIVVFCIAVVVGVMIALMDSIILEGVNFLTSI